MNMEREELHRLVEQLPESEVPTAQRFLQFLRDTDPVRKALEAAPFDDEPLTEEDRDRIHQADKDLKEGRTLSMDEVKRELGL